MVDMVLGASLLLFLSTLASMGVSLEFSPSLVSSHASIPPYTLVVLDLAEGAVVVSERNLLWYGVLWADDASGIVVMLALSGALEKELTADNQHISTITTGIIVLLLGDMITILTPVELYGTSSMCDHMGKAREEMNSVVPTTSLQQQHLLPHSHFVRRVT